MKTITAFIASPRKEGVTTQIANALLSSVKDGKVEIINLYDLDLKGCTACGYCKKDVDDYCSIKDGMSDLYTKIVDSDILVFGSPIYFGTFTGVGKIFIDRLYSFMKKDFKSPALAGKKMITISTSGAPEEVFCIPTSAFYKKWFGDFFGMEIIKQINLGGMMDDSMILGDGNAVIVDAKEFGEGL